MRYKYDRETTEIIDTEVLLDKLRVYATVPFHENGERITKLLNSDEEKKGETRQPRFSAKHPEGW